MLKRLADVQPPGVAVLLIGDGAGYDTGVGFYADLEHMADAATGHSRVRDIGLRTRQPRASVYFDVRNARAPSSLIRLSVRVGGRRL